MDNKCPWCNAELLNEADFGIQWNCMSQYGEAGARQTDRCRVSQLEAAIRTHRDQHADDRCWLDDQELYKVLNDGNLGDNRVGNKEEMLKNCSRYLDKRCSGGNWKSYAELEAENAKLRKQLDDYTNEYAGL
jgi:hypothetical protein